MQWVILIGDDTLNLDIVRNIDHYGNPRVSEIRDNRFSVDYGHDHIFYDYTENIINDYEVGELKDVPFENPKFIMMVYTSEDLMRRILKQKNFLRGIYVDDDEGHIEPIEVFIRE